MTANGWLQIAFFSLCVLLGHQAARAVPGRVYDGSLHWLGPSSALIYRVCGVDPRRGPALDSVCGGMLLFSAVVDAVDLRRAAAAARPAAQPANMPAVPDRQAFETAGVVHDEHELAVVQRASR